jgi:hypothetical protein
MKTQPCFEPPRHLEEAAELAERRKREAIARLTEKLGINRDRSKQAVRDSSHSHAPVIDAEPSASLRAGPLCRSANEVSKRAL